MQDSERDAPAVAVDDCESGPLDTDGEVRTETWATMRDAVEEDEESSMQDLVAEEEGVIKDDNSAVIHSDSADAELGSAACRGDSFERDHDESEPELAAAVPVRAAPVAPAPVSPEPAAEAAEIDTRRQTNRSVGHLWQELLAEAAGAEIEAMHWDQAGSPAAAIECYRRVAVKILEAAESLEKSSSTSVREVLEQRATEALERVATLEASHGASSSASDAPLYREHSSKLTTEGILASTLATTAAQLDDSSCKSSLRSEDAKILGTAATIGGAAGMLLMGPISAACLGAMAAYATTRENPTGATARKVCTTSIGMADSAVNKAVGTGLKAADLALEEGRRRLLDGLNGSASTGERSAIKDWCRENKDKCVRAVAAVEAIQAALPRRKLSEEARRMKTRYPDRVPVLCERGPGARSDLPDIERKKFAVPDGMRFGEFKYIVHKQVAQAARSLAVDETIYLFVGDPGVQPKTSATMAELYKLHGAEDGFLCIRYTAENTLGRRCACT